MQRRTLLTLGAGAAIALALAGGGLAMIQPGLREGRLTSSGRDVFEAIARAVLDGSLPEDAPSRHAALAAHLTRLDDAIGALPPATQAELGQLLSLLASAAGRIGLASLLAPWPDASIEQLQSSLAAMRHSSMALKQQAYHALRDLTNAAYYADPGTWAQLGYPGPRDI